MILTPPRQAQVPNATARTKSQPIIYQVYLKMNSQPQPSDNASRARSEPANQSSAGSSSADTSAASEQASSSSIGPIPEAIVRTVPRRHWSWTWLVPIAALGVALTLLLQARAEQGRIIRIRFEDGGGIQANDPLMYRGFHAGRIKSVTLASDLNGVVVTAELRNDAQTLAVDGSKFWIVRPVVSLTRVSGLETLIGPRYIEVEPGPVSSILRSDFIGLERSPTGVDGSPKKRGETGRGKLLLIVQAPKRGSVTVGSPVFYRDVKVGVVTAFELSDDARTVDMSVSIEAEYAGLVRTNSKFWNASGIGVDFGFSSGFSLKAGSIESVFAGGIAFATPTKAGTRAKPGSVFKLENEAEKNWWDWAPDLSDTAAGQEQDQAPPP